jgi:L-amino acid N-acyltransferase YncA
MSAYVIDAGGGGDAETASRVAAVLPSLTTALKHKRCDRSSSTEETCDVEGRVELLRTDEAWRATLSLEEQQQLDCDLEVLRCLLNAECKAGTYPQTNTHDMKQFLAYYCSHAVFVCRSSKTNQVLGSFYVKPNFPGRCSHICNAGFLVLQEWRGRGVGRLLANAFVKVAPLLNYKAAFFNLVFTDNPASMALWQSLGFEQTGRVPAAKYSQVDGSPIDALMLYKAFD